MIHTQFFTASKYYEVTEDTPCIPGNLGDTLIKGEHYFCKERLQMAGIEFCLLQKIVSGYPSGEGFLYKLSDRPNNRHHLCAINPIIFQT